MINLALESCEATGFLGFIVEWALGIIGAAGYFGALLIVMIENVLPFIPSEIILPTLGMAASRGEFGIAGWLGFIVIILVTTFASLLGASILFGICRLFGFERVAALPFIETEKVELANKWFMKRGDAAVMICRVIPVVRVLITIPAGLSKMSYRRFLIFSTIGTVVWNTALCLVGYLVGQKWCDIEPIFSKFSHIVVGVLLVVLVIAIWLKGKLTKKALDGADQAATAGSTDAGNPQGISTAKAISEDSTVLVDSADTENKDLANTVDANGAESEAKASSI